MQKNNIQQKYKLYICLQILFLKKKYLYLLVGLFKITGEFINFEFA